MSDRPAKKQRLDGEGHAAPHYAEQDTSDEDDSSSDQEESSSEGEDEQYDEQPPPSPSKDKGKKKAVAKHIVTASAGDAYLQGASSSSKTSDALLSTYLTRPFTSKSYAAALAKYDALPTLRRPPHPKETMQAKWAWELEQGFNLLLHGFGSRRKALNAFAEFLRRRHGPVVVVDGYDPAVSMSEIMGALEALVPKATASAPVGSTQIDKRVRNLLQCLDQHPPMKPIYLVIHSLDRGALAPSKALALLSAVTSHRLVRLTASIDHVRSVLLFPSSMINDLPPPSTTHATVSRAFSFLFHELTTLEPYTAEVAATSLLSRILPPTLFPPPSLGSSSKHSSLASAQFVLATVTPSSRLLFLLLTQLQLASTPASATNASAAAVPLSALQEQAIERMIALGAPQVNALLSEFRDHGVVKDGNADGGKTVTVALRRDELEELLDREGVERDE